jgi:predicted O-methyltransferase YrrM
MTVRNVLRDIYRQLMRYRIFAPLHFAHRMLHTWRYYIWPGQLAWIVWLFRSRESVNFTYDLTDRCKLHLAAGLSAILGENTETLQEFMNEIEHDVEFRSHMHSLLQRHPLRYRTDDEPRIGRRMVWYAIVRVTKPSLVVETGVDQGMGAVVLCAALRRNASEGHPGRYLGTDNNPLAGYFLKGEYAKFGEVLYGDSLKSLEGLNAIDVFINDSDHSADYEQAEYEVVRDRLTPRAIVLGDNAHVTSKLAEFSLRNNRRFIFLAEEPANHWYKGAGVGVSCASR